MRSTRTILFLILPVILLYGQTETNSDFGMNLGLGAATIDGEIYNQIALRPDVSAGKLGVGLDLILYLDANGKVRTDEWDEAQDILDKFLYIRWGRPGDPFHIRYGTLNRVTIGYGILVKNYSNMMEFPSIRKVGLHTGYELPIPGLRIGMEAFIANLKEFTPEPEFSSGLIGLRATYRMGKLLLGASYITDGNQYLGLQDKDRDGYPDMVDDFPEDEIYAIDTDGDGDPDENDLDVDGDGITDVLDPATMSWWTGPYTVLDEFVHRKAEPLNLREDKKSLRAVNIDIGYPLIDEGPLTIMATIEAAHFLGNHVSLLGTDSLIEHGYGFAPGLRGKLLNFVNYGVEFRQTTGNFAFNVFDRNYDLQRVLISRDENNEAVPMTRDMQVLENPPLTGLYGSLSASIADWITLSGSYQDMRQDSTSLKGLTASVGVAPDRIPKVREATAYLLRMNVDDPFDLMSEGTLMGYRVSIGIAGGVNLTWDFKQTFRDLNGDGVIFTGEGSDEVLTITTLETGFSF